ncbi:hypothetical protein [Jiangella asiatica]|uniref:Uncharacterized protein n=1 Tax=Jiangella asiatica TaxID=2530372 RepID=A0A4V2Z0F1_9ACTN|nr:hypothetical protein [Jiangella asiatica]TDE00788.1 hypothetical protein E1269_24620 [Jiangella asiatica]
MTADARPETIPPGGLAPTLPWWTLRLGLAASSVGAVAAVGAWTSASPFLLVALGLLGLATVAQPASQLPTAFLAAVALLALGADGVTALTSLAVLTLHATHVLAALAAVVPPSTAVERAALRPSLERFVLAQAAGQVLVVLAWLVSP